mgnify:FL=1
MKKLVFLALSVSLFFTSQAQVKTPAPSPLQTIKQDFGLGTLEVSYSRPAVKGRKIFGDLVPFGNVWRTGANSATTLTFSDEVSIGGVKIAPGKYGLLSIPNKDNWTIIISKQTDVTSPAAYKQEMDIVRINAATADLKYKIENFAIVIDNIKSNQCEIGLYWDKTKVSFTVETDIDTRIMQQIETAMKGDKAPYFNAAMYYMDNGKDLNQALSWFEKAAAATPTAYWVHHQLANCLAKLGKKAEAKAAATKSKELALAAKNMDYVKLNEKLLADLK